MLNLFLSLVLSPAFHCQSWAFFTVVLNPDTEFLFLYSPSYYSYCRLFKPIFWGRFLRSAMSDSTNSLNPATPLVPVLPVDPAGVVEPPLPPPEEPLPRPAPGELLLRPAPEQPLPRGGRALKGTRRRRSTGHMSCDNLYYRSSGRFTWRELSIRSR